MSAKTSTTEFIATGRRKTSSARVRIKEGTGNFLINGKEYSDYCSTEESRKIVLSPLASVDMVGGVDITVNVSGGGSAGQAGAIRHGISKALVFYEPDLRPPLKKAGFLTRDSRVVERKKYGRKKARRSFQFSKR